ncbi:MAG: hypothetical protein GC191_15470 [Azospirillum sp.]|nr:hypothetical protein [Azospirillum sp.]
MALIYAGSALAFSGPIPYQAAIEDAAIAEPSEVHELVPLPAPTATVVSWADPKYYKLGPATDLGINLWVTVAPQVQTQCRSFDSDDKTARIEQLLGLAGGKGHGRAFITLEVAAKDVFRPCPDTRTDSVTCPILPPSAAPPGVALEQWLRDSQFVLNQILSSYRKPDGYPFTRLGYTYDWGPDSAAHVGASEYVLRKGSSYTVLSIDATESFCAAP